MRLCLAKHPVLIVYCLLVTFVFTSYIVQAQVITPDNESPEVCEEARLASGENHNVLFGGVALPGQMQSSGNTYFGPELPPIGVPLSNNMGFGNLDDTGTYSVTQGPHATSGNQYGYTVLYGLSDNPDEFGVIIIQFGYTTVYFEDPTLQEIYVETGYDGFVARYGEDDGHLCLGEDFSQILIIAPEGQATSVSVTKLGESANLTLTIASGLAVTVDDIEFAVFLLFGELQEFSMNGQADEEVVRFMEQNTIVAAADIINTFRWAWKEGKTEIDKRDLNIMLNEEDIFGVRRNTIDKLWKNLFIGLDNGVQVVVLDEFIKAFPGSEESEEEEESEPETTNTGDLIEIEEGTWFIVQPDGSCSNNSITFYEQDTALGIIHAPLNPLEHLRTYTLEAPNYYTLQYEEAHPTTDNMDRTRTVEWRLQVISPREIRRTQAWYQENGDFVSPEKGHHIGLSILVTLMFEEKETEKTHLIRR